MIINDKRYGALKTLGERKQAFNEVSLIHGCMYKINYIPSDGFTLSWNLGSGREVWYSLSHNQLGMK